MKQIQCLIQWWAVVLVVPHRYDLSQAYIIVINCA
jgi:hypothetical protein